MNEITSEKMLQIVSHAKEKAKQAMDDFDYASDMLEIKTKKQINLYGGTATSEVVDIAAESRDICDNIYISLQSLIQIVDEDCRPLITQQPSLTAVKEVYQLIKWLNEESKIKAIFSASVNSVDLGNIVSGRYIPKMESKMIEKYWEEKYDTWADWVYSYGGNNTMPIKLSENTLELENSLARTGQRIDFTPTPEEQEYAKVYRQWQIDVEESKKQCEEESEQEVQNIKLNLEQKSKENYDKTVKEQNEEKEYQLNRIREAQAELKKLSFFKFAAINAQQEIINESDRKYKEASVKLEEAENEYKKDMERAGEEAESERYFIKKRVMKNYIEPEPPAKPLSIIDIQNSNLAIKKAIRTGMDEGVMYTIKDLRTQIPAIMDLSSIRLSSMIGQMIKEGEVERIDKDGKGYFKLK